MSIITKICVRLINKNRNVDMQTCRYIYGTESQARRIKNQTSMDKGCYQWLVGKLIYLSHTRPDIAYAMSVVNQFMHSAQEKSVWKQYIKSWHTWKVHLEKDYYFLKKRSMRLKGIQTQIEQEIKLAKINIRLFYFYRR